MHSPSTTSFPGTVEVRRLVRDDAFPIHEIHCACLTRTFMGRYTDAQISAWMEGRSPDGYLGAWKAGEHFLVACIEGAVIGYVSWQDRELLSLFVHPDFQARGVGSRLIEACLAEAVTQAGPIIRVKAALGADGFYLRYGFAPVGLGSTTKQGIEIPDTRMVRQSP